MLRNHKQTSISLISKLYDLRSVNNFPPRGHSIELRPLSRSCTHISHRLYFISVEHIFPLYSSSTALVRLSVEDFDKHRLASAQSRNNLSILRGFQLNSLGRTLPSCPLAPEVKTSHRFHYSYSQRSSWPTTPSLALTGNNLRQIICSSFLRNIPQSLGIQRPHKLTVATCLLQTRQLHTQWEVHMERLPSMLRLQA